LIGNEANGLDLCPNERTDWAKWIEFDLEAARWNIPAGRMEMRTSHIVPLARQSLEVLDTLRTLSGNSEWLFPGERDPAKQMSNNTILKALERMGYKSTMTGHRFRGLASTLLARAKMRA
jgi:integrase